ncbi:substrate-binding periplasmic protein [Shewanella waksmanii]|uniref:substrate-binding periplasmic protein n=1 Tax=Shewanella waksmanii TaxID=213783 RepID=UPI00373668AF
MPIRQFFYALVFTLSCAEVCYANPLLEGPKSVKLAAEDNWAPFADHSGTGLSHQLINDAFSRMQVQVNSIIVPYARGVKMAQQGQVDGVFNLVKEQSTEHLFIFGQQPLFTASASFYQNNNHPLNVDDKYQLPQGTRVGIIEGYEYGDELVELTHLQLLRVSNHNQLINLLLLNRIDAAIMYNQVADQYLSKMNVTREISPQFHNHTGVVYLAFSKQNPDAQLLADTLDAGLLALKADGRYQQIMAMKK